MPKRTVSTFCKGPACKHARLAKDDKYDRTSPDSTIRYIASKRQRTALAASSRIKRLKTTTSPPRTNDVDHCTKLDQDEATTARTDSMGSSMSATSIQGAASVAPDGISPRMRSTRNLFSPPPRDRKNSPLSDTDDEAPQRAEKENCATKSTLSSSRRDSDSDSTAEASRDLEREMTEFFGVAAANEEEMAEARRLCRSIPRPSCKWTTPRRSIRSGLISSTEAPATQSNAAGGIGGPQRGTPVQTGSLLLQEGDPEAMLMDALSPRASSPLAAAFCTSRGFHTVPSTSHSSSTTIDGRIKQQLADHESVVSSHEAPVSPSFVRGRQGQGRRRSLMLSGGQNNAPSFCFTPSPPYSRRGHNQTAENEGTPSTNSGRHRSVTTTSLPRPFVLPPHVPVEEQNNSLTTQSYGSVREPAQCDELSESESFGIITDMAGSRCGRESMSALQIGRRLIARYRGSSASEDGSTDDNDEDSPMSVLQRLSMLRVAQ